MDRVQGSLGKSINVIGLVVESHTNLVTFNDLVISIHVGRVGGIYRRVLQRVVVIDSHAQDVVDVLDDPERRVVYIVLDLILLLIDHSTQERHRGIVGIRRVSLSRKVWN